MFVIASCVDDAKEDQVDMYNCEFDPSDKSDNGIIDDEERGIMNECIIKALASREDIERNLIGEWQLVGHGEGWFVSVPEPCGYLTFSEDQLILDITSTYRDTVSSHEWMIEEVKDDLGSKFNLKIEPFAHELAITVFCESYMYGNFTPVDGNMYLYEKVK